MARQRILTLGAILYLTDLIGVRSFSVEGEAGIWIPFAHNDALNVYNGKAALTLTASGDFKDETPVELKLTPPPFRRKVGVTPMHAKPWYPAVGWIRRKLPPKDTSEPVEVRPAPIHDTEDDIITL